MNFLAIVNRLRSECGISSTPLTTLNGVTGESLRCKEWVATAYADIQSDRQDWQWLRTSASFQTIAGLASYTTEQCGIQSGQFGMWAADTFRNYLTSVGVNSEIFMNPIGYEEWRNGYQYGAMRLTQSRPVIFALGPSKEICVGPTPTGDYTITADYYLSPQSLSNDEDVPLIPTQFQMILVWKAMLSYGMFETAPEVVQRAQSEYTSAKRRLEHDRLPSMSTGAALA